MHPRMRRERETIEKLIAIFCRHHHTETAGGLCDECRQLLDYAFLRLSHCPFQEGKTTCGNCPRHCYKPGMRERIRAVMRFSGPRMLCSHPLLAIGHMIDGFRKTPILKK